MTAVHPEASRQAVVEAALVLLERMGLSPADLAAVPPHRQPVPTFCAAARAYPLAGVKKTELDTALGYFENNAPRMRYKWFRSRGLFVGSGAVEAGCKAVIGQRLKMSGMRWTVAGADAITALRCREASSQWEVVCAAPNNQTGAA